MALPVLLIVQGLFLGRTSQYSHTPLHLLTSLSRCCQIKRPRVGDGDWLVAGVGAIVKGPDPIPPFAFNPDQCHQELVEYYHCHMRPPGEPILIPVVRNTNTVSQQQHCSRARYIHCS